MIKYYIHDNPWTDNNKCIILNLIVTFLSAEICKVSFPSKMICWQVIRKIFCQFVVCIFLSWVYLECVYLMSEARLQILWKCKSHCILLGKMIWSSLLGTTSRSQKFTSAIYVCISKAIPWQNVMLMFPCLQK